MKHVWVLLFLMVSFCVFAEDDEKVGAETSSDETTVTTESSGTDSTTEQADRSTPQTTKKGRKPQQVPLPTPPRSRPTQPTQDNQNVKNFEKERERVRKELCSININTVGC